MKTKRFLLLICFLISVKAFCQKASTNKQSAYPLKITLVDLEKNTPHHNGDVFHKLRIKITNTADTAFSFWVMTCSWHGCVSFDPYIIKSDLMGCDGNFPEEIVLKPDSSFSLDAGYKLNKSIANPVIQLSAGFRVITRPKNNPGADSLKLDTNDDIVKFGNRFQKFIDLFNYDPQYTKNDYIWSKPIVIKFNPDTL